MHQHIFFESPVDGTEITADSTVYYDCVLTQDLGEYLAGYEVDQIIVDYTLCKISWLDDGKLIVFKMEAVQMGGK